ncbi:caspase family protein [uncultured Aquimarina sp.]|uniref:caspase family protein n=1 Tax=uncultured Aquimarina sp. TaxID=575652 RepID=UPI00261E4DB2|nr:caspase family protein [uncultured Aquimarina sp.]
MVEERRFAIIIGINDYEVSPLNFCVNDAKAVAKILEEKCCFKNEDIHLITSDEKKSTKDISGHFNNILTAIQKNLKPLKDSIFFFFAGHGKYQFENSGLQFHDSFIEISQIFEKLNELQPKYQCYVVDACESGGKVLTRNQNNENLINQYISKSTGTLFMYASTESETAKEFSDIKHGLFTYYFLSAINNKGIYDNEGVLTPNRIQDFIARETQKESDFKQTPVIENRTIGYYPFAFQNPSEIITPIKKKEVNDKKESRKNKPTTILEQYFPVIPFEIRELIFTELKDEVNIIFEKFLKQEKFSNYEQSNGSNFDIYDYEISDKLKDSVVNKSVSEKVISLDSTFSSERELIKPNPFLTAFSMLDAMLQKNKQEYQINNYINWNENRILSKTLFLKSKQITNVSCGISIIVYQALYGLGLATLSFYLDFNGYTNNNLRGPFTKIRAYKINNKTKDNIIGRIKNELENFLVDLKKWNDQRQSAIDDFDKKSK